MRAQSFGVKLSAEKEVDTQQRSRIKLLDGTPQHSCGSSPERGPLVGRGVVSPPKNVARSAE